MCTPYVPWYDARSTGPTDRYHNSMYGMIGLIDGAVLLLMIEKH